MSRHRLSLLAASAFAGLGATSAFAYDAGLVRIEPRAYYGAVVTMEQGVRVYRPLPTQNLMIINPNQTPVSLNFSRTIEHRAADSDGGYGGGDGDGYGGWRYGGISGFGDIAGTNPRDRKNHGNAAGRSYSQRGVPHRPHRRSAHR